MKYTQRGSITVSCRAFNQPEGLRNTKQVTVEIIVGDTGCGIPASKLESIFREFEQVESAQPKTSMALGLGLGLAVVARAVGQLGGQLRVDSKVNQGSQFSSLIPFTVWDESRQHLLGQDRYQRPEAPVSYLFPSTAILGAEMSIEQDRDLSVLPLPGQGIIDNVPVTPDSQMAPPHEAVEVDVKAVELKPRPLPSLGRRRTVHPEDRSPVRGSETKGQRYQSSDPGQASQIGRTYSRQYDEWEGGC